MRVVKAFAAEPRQLAALRAAASQRVFDQSMIATRLRAFYNPFIGFLPSVGLAVILLVGGRQVIDGSLSLGDFTAFYAYLLMLIGPMRSARHRPRPGPARDGVRRAAVRDPRPRARARRTAGCAAAPGGTRPGRAARRHVPATRAPPRPALSRHRPRRRGRHDGRAGRRHRLRQDHARPAARAALRRERGRGADRRRRRPRRSTCRRCGAAISVVDDDPFLFSATVAENIAYGRPDATQRGGRARRRARAGGGLHRRAAERLRHADRRARAHALGRPAPADRDRARAAVATRGSSCSTTRPRRSTPRPSRRSRPRCAR